MYDVKNRGCWPIGYGVSRLNGQQLDDVARSGYFAGIGARMVSRTYREPIGPKLPDGQYVGCDRCGQLTAYVPDVHFYEDVVCGACRERDRAPQGETVRLFQPAPASIPGQLNL